MTNYTAPNDAPFDIDWFSWIYDSTGNRLPIIARTRRAVVDPPGPSMWAV